MLQGFAEARGLDTTKQSRKSTPYSEHDPKGDEMTTRHLRSGETTYLEAAIEWVIEQWDDAEEGDLPFRGSTLTSALHALESIGGSIADGERIVIPAWRDGEA